MSLAKYHDRSPALIPKPNDWGSHISLSGFFFLEQASNFTPAPDLKAFLDAGPPPGMSDLLHVTSLLGVSTNKTSVHRFWLDRCR